MEVFAVDDQGQPVNEPGKEGEPVARGSCVAQGYWGDPEKLPVISCAIPINRTSSESLTALVILSPCMKIV
jgi:acyl-CoA synthetase (AMP-forming)/AMP-acid ligase II